MLALLQDTEQLLVLSRRPVFIFLYVERDNVSFGCEADRMVSIYHRAVDSPDWIHKPCFVLFFQEIPDSGVKIPRLIFFKEQDLTPVLV